MKENKKLIEIEATLKNFSSLPLRSLGDNKNNLNSSANYIMPEAGYAGTSQKDCYALSPSHLCRSAENGGLWMVDKMIPTIFKKNVKNNSKLRPLNEITSDVGEIQYFPAWSKEWRNSVYHYNSNLIKNFPVYDMNIYKIIKSYFSMFFNHQFLKYKYIRPRRRRLSFNKIFLARPEIKHTNSKAIITLYTFNREKFALLKKIKILTKLTKKIIMIVQQKNCLLKIEKIFFKFNMIFAILKDRNLLQNFYAYFSALKTSKSKAKEQANKWIKLIFNKEFTLIRKYKFRLNLNKYKFEDKLLYGLSNIIRKLYNKQIEFNIVNLKNIVFNTDLFTEISTLKIKKRNARVVRIMNIMLNKANLPKVNRIQEKGRIVNNVNLKLVENKYKTLNLKDILSGKLNLDKLLNKIYTSINDKFLPHYAPEKGLYDMVFNSIKYKNMRGIRMEVKGRLTKRYRADRSVLKLRWKGGLKNIDSSYKGLSVRKNRGYLNPNVGYSIFSSKRRIGAFAVKGWTGAKGYSSLANSFHEQKTGLISSLHLEL
nr:ribosomal protein S3 [Valsa mali var. pyri (nom. inval.)]